MLYLSENHSHVYSEISANILLLLLLCDVEKSACFSACLQNQFYPGINSQELNLAS